ncbi:MAG: PHP domain-containing protein [bacterium]
MDWVVASVHYDTGMSEREMTERLCTAISSGVVHALGHPLNRLIGKREAVRFDVDAVVAACVEHGVCLEIDAQPERLDLPDFHCKRAREAGASLVIDTDAHKPSDLDFMPLGVSVARRGWLRRRDVVNTFTPERLARWIRGDRS